MQKRQYTPTPAPSTTQAGNACRDLLRGPRPQKHYRASEEQPNETKEERSHISTTSVSSTTRHHRQPGTPKSRRTNKPKISKSHPHVHQRVCVCGGDGMYRWEKQKRKQIRHTAWVASNDPVVNASPTQLARGRLNRRHTNTHRPVFQHVPPPAPRLVGGSGCQRQLHNRHCRQNNQLVRGRMRRNVGLSDAGQISGTRPHQQPATEQKTRLIRVRPLIGNETHNNTHHRKTAS